MSTPDHSGIANGLARVRGQIAAAAARAGRKAEGVRLIAACKTFDADTVREAIGCDQTVFGENYVQEAKAKWPGLKDEYPHTELHLIGPLQSNKAREAVALFDVIHSLDRHSLAKALSRQCENQGRQPVVYVQVNTGEERQKSGVLPAEADEFISACRNLYQLNVTGLMCIPPAGQSSEQHFDLLAKIAARNGLSELSMGMSSDYAAAVAHGATSVRVGSAIFGNRVYPPAAQ
ncbi:YggS family pyridoxal phosphate-dependent enzyme [Streptomyces marincola]|uniref:YggS family pyridoxal phosphate-dependent enzyme n=1 Tax=Streptomyces marincola TaxID=2878388 RepID=UPI001CF3A607|nr:YggS family pyridoxal phosphate-dependent enzyme [Streptomyces marincola]UCM89964.1 YggS family pyridoxal phosphate-dependent enzyme [Streptomyces marincola]